MFVSFALVSCASTSQGGTPRDATGVMNASEASCAFSYSPTTLAQRSWAFDGTLVSVGSLDDSHLGAVPSATFSVKQWFRGGSGDRVTVQFQIGRISESGPNVGTGARLLVAGEPRWGGQPLNDPVAWGCGFTQLWTESAAESWADALGA